MCQDEWDGGSIKLLKRIRVVCEMHIPEKFSSLLGIYSLFESCFQDALFFAK